MPENALWPAITQGSGARSPMGENPNSTGASRYHLIRTCEASLKRLHTDHIDLYQIHNWDGIMPVEETLMALDHLVHSGKVRYVGMSNYTAWLKYRPGITSLIVGARNPQQLRDNLAAADLQLTPEQTQKLNRRRDKRRIIHTGTGLLRRWIVLILLNNRSWMSTGASFKLANNTAGRQLQPGIRVR